MRSDQTAVLVMSKRANVCASQIMPESSAISARTETTTTQAAHIASATFTEQSPEFVTKTPENVSAKMATDRHAATDVFLDFTTIQSAFHVIVHWLARCKLYAISTESAHACKISLVNAAISAWRAFTNFPSAFRAIAITTARLESRATTMASATVKTISTAKIATRARKISIITHCARVATVTQLESSPRLLDADLCQQESCVNARSAFKEESAISAGRSIGT
jgi:hypothetical protein